MGRAPLIVDTSAIVAILYREPEAARFVDVLTAEASPRMSTAAYVEASLVLGGNRDPRYLAGLDPLLDSLGMVLEPLTVAQARLACAAGQRFGKGHHPAALNYGDCCTYALAKETGEPLLFKGKDFSQTDIVVALPL